MVELDWEDFFTNSVAGVYVTTPEGQVLRVNAALARLMGYGTAEQLVEELVDVASIYVPPARRAEFAELLHRTGQVVEFESMVRRRDGTLLWIAESSWAIRDDDGRTVAFAGILVDATARRQAVNYDRYMAQVRLAETTAKRIQQGVATPLHRAREAMHRNDLDALAHSLDDALAAIDELGSLSPPRGRERAIDARAAELSARQATGGAGGEAREFAFHLAGMPESVPRARRLVREVLKARGVSEHLPVVELLTSEVVTNAVLHTPSDIRLSISVGDTVRVAVTDRSKVLPAVADPDLDAMTGRGMALVKSLSTASGLEPAPDGKTVWFELALDDPPWRDAHGDDGKDSQQAAG